MDKTYKSIEVFSQPDDFGPIKASDIYNYERLRVITDAHQFIIPFVFLAAAIVMWLAARTVLSGALARLGTLLRLWFDAKERELRQRAGKIQDRSGADQNRQSIDGP